MSVETREPSPATPFDERRGVRGPITNRLVARRGVGLLAAVWLTGLALFLLAGSPGWAAVGQGLMFPGGGFLAAGHPVLFAGTLVAFLLAMVLWFVLSPVLAPPLVWLGAAALAGWLAGPGAGWGWAAVVVPALLPLSVLAVLGAQWLGLRRGRARAARRNALLGTLKLTTNDRFVADSAPELSAEDLAHQRFLFDLGLQPMDAFEGFSSVDQFRESAYRYQLNYAGWALALATFTRTPAFAGYSLEAQRRLIEKMAHPKVWGYWYWENMLGNLELNPDPIRRDNIMYSGYLGVQIAAFEAATGDTTFSRPGALSYDWKGRRSWSYDFHTISHRVFEQMDRASYCAFPCEPNWVYPVCNSIAMAGLVGHDTRYGTDYWPRLEQRFRHSLEVEFATPAGNPIPVRSNRLGITFPGISASTMNEAILSFWFNPFLPGLAARTWTVAREEVMSIDGDGLAHLVKQSPVDGIDLGTYRPDGGAMLCAMASLAACEMGDEEMRDALLARLERLAPPVTRDGAARYTMSTTALTPAAMGRFGHRDAWRHLLNAGHPEQRRRGPRLACAPYPEVLVARAVSDGADLALVLRPGGLDGWCGGRVRLGLDQLRTGARYRCAGTLTGELTADGRGCAEVEVDLADRTEVTITPL